MENKEGIIEVNEEYLDSSSESGGSISSAVSKASRQSKRSRATRNNTIQGNIMNKKRMQNNNLKIDVNSRNDSNDSMSPRAGKGSNKDLSRRKTVAPATALPGKATSLFISGKKDERGRLNSSRVRDDTSQNSDRSRKGRTSKTRKNRNDSEESESDLNSRPSMLRFNTTKKESGNIQVTKFDLSPGIPA